MSQKLSLKDAQMIAEKRGGLCLSNEYINNRTPLQWRCAKGHEWAVGFDNIKNAGTWYIAQIRNGECLSDKFINTRTPLLWRCAKGHEWASSLHNMKNRGTWCPYCAKVVRYTIEDAKQVAFSRNGECLSTEYINSHLPLLWKCCKGHEWSARFSHIKNSRRWCPYCSKTLRLTLEHAKQIAHSKNGECLSNRYINCNTHLLWRCAKAHEWVANIASIKNNNSWCPFCSEHPTGLELDIPYYYYGFAIEVQGKQHEHYIKHFHRTSEGFNNLLARDQLKKELYDENWIYLIEIWYYEDPHIVIPQYLYNLGLID
ncbi:hypothetical protein Glove_822g5 [Diversispora epigaea]|uniref:Treble clef zinc finger domain-containing protein n=1 Tax=Diversispora epigaea TaxID=1348612 RepID=A0A397FYQ2_9GLOM|nr:hypothetical protein Glove_822g5 [Diversispora epigaea]